MNAHIFRCLQEGFIPVVDWQNYMMNRCPVKKYIYDIANEKIMSDGIRSMTGILVRGTDYTKLKPAGHPIPPSPEMDATQKTIILNLAHTDTNSSMI